MTKQENVVFVKKNSLLTNTPKQKHVAENVPQNFVGIEEITFDGYEDVYNMEVANNHNFAVNGGLIVHNCMDSARYFVQTMNIVKKKEKYKPLLTR